MKLLNIFLSFSFIFSPFTIKDNIDLIILNMTLEEKVGQMFFVRLEALDSNYISDEESGKYIVHDIITEDMLNTYNNYPCGGIVLFNRNLNDERQLIELTNSIHELKYKPLICIDEEGGTVSRIANSKKFNVKKTLDNDQIDTTKDAYDKGAYIASYLNKYHIDVNFAPVADLNINPNNPIIGNRSFGSDPNITSELVNSFIDGLHTNNIYSCIKHFPGHGNTKGDSHSDSVYIDTSKQDWLKQEALPFIQTLNNTDMIMAGHIETPNITSDNLPASLSKEMLTDILRKQFNYDGIIITDSLEMGAISKYYSSKEAAVMAINAGVDILLMPENYKEAFDGVIEAINNNEISEERINESVRKILKLKINRTYQHVD